MSVKSKIEWTDATWNPVTGCTKVSEGCRNCYALTFAERWRGVPGHYFENGFDIQQRPHKLADPLKWTKPRKIFVNSMSDLFHKEISDDFIAQVFAVMSIAHQHTFQVLTKRPDRMRSLLNSGLFWIQVNAARFGRGVSVLPGAGPVLLPNVWLGVSVENQKAADERIPLLLQAPAAVRFLSCEPLLGQVDLVQAGALGCDCPDIELPDGTTEERCSGRCAFYKNAIDKLRRIDWVIAGGESGPGARPMDPEWLRGLRDQCQAAGVPFFFKQWGEWAPVHELRANEPGVKGKQWYNFDPDASVCKVGKKAAGRLLDGRTWDEMPEDK